MEIVLKKMVKLELGNEDGFRERLEGEELDEGDEHGKCSIELLFFLGEL